LQGEKMTADRDPVHAMGMRFAMEGLSEDQINVEADPYAQRSFMLAALAHLLLISMLFLGVQWVTSEPAPMQAELWGALPAAPQPPSAPPQPPKVEPKPEPKPQVKPEPKPQVKPEPPVKPDITLKDEKKKPKEEPKKPELKKEEPKKEPVKKEPPKKEEPKKEEPKKEDSKKEDLKKAEKLEQEKKREAEREKALAELMNKDSSRVLGNINASTTGSAAAGAARDAGYADRVISKIRGNMTRSGCDIPGNPEAVFMVEQLSSGEIVRVTKKRSTGFIACDETMERAIYKSNPLPRAKEGNYERELELSIKPKDIK
jgi:colicin import membrane protein